MHILLFCYMRINPKRSTFHDFILSIIKIINFYFWKRRSITLFFFFFFCKHPTSSSQTLIVYDMYLCPSISQQPTLVKKKNGNFLSFNFRRKWSWLWFLSLRDQGPGTSSWCWFFIVVGCFISVTGILQQCGPEESKNANSH